MKDKTQQFVTLFGTVIVGIFVLFISFGIYRTVTKNTREPAAVIQNQVSVEPHGNRTTLSVKVYAYCPCSICNTKKWAGKLTGGERMATYFRKGIKICAADPTVIPLGFKIMFDGEEYTVADVGKDIKGNTIDILLDNHKATLKFGIKENQIITIKD